MQIHNIALLEDPGIDHCALHTYIVDNNQIEIQWPYIYKKSIYASTVALKR